jgi:hypothetical protein
MLGHGGAHYIPAFVDQSDHHVKQPKRRGRHNEYIDRSDPFGLIEQEGPATTIFADGGIMHGSPGL